MTFPTGVLSKDEFLRANERSMRSLRSMHPDKPDELLAEALWQAAGLGDFEGSARIIRAALLLLD
ncbi:hypothetical protein [Luteolibacter soli]|uniref:hypothetical protein n=1 Tax=Luteolibacter soli TaxID=3135280 RepID=UPI00311A13D4